MHILAGRPSPHGLVFSTPDLDLYSRSGARFVHTCLPSLELWYASVQQIRFSNRYSIVCYQDHGSPDEPRYPTG